MQHRNGATVPPYCRSPKEAATTIHAHAVKSRVEGRVRARGNVRRPRGGVSQFGCLCLRPTVRVPLWRAAASRRRRSSLCPLCVLELLR
eukprot:4878807-Prymnesium_polylepis.1